MISSRGAGASIHTLINKIIILLIFLFLSEFPTPTPTSTPRRVDFYIIRIFILLSLLLGRHIDVIRIVLLLAFLAAAVETLDTLCRCRFARVAGCERETDYEKEVICFSITEDVSELVFTISLRV
jgi:hypothetical protein